MLPLFQKRIPAQVASSHFKPARHKLVIVYLKYSLTHLRITQPGCTFFHGQPAFPAGLSLLEESSSSVRPYFFSLFNINPGIS